MSEKHDQSRRRMLGLLAAGGALAFTQGPARAGVGVMVPGKGWVEASGKACEGDGTPLQFIPKTAPDADPLTDELKKYPTCPYCGMNRTKWAHSRHLVQYDDDLVDGVCSIHCLAISLSLNLDRGPKAIYAADFSSEEKIKPLMPVDNAHYLIGSALPGTMSKQSKMAFASDSALRAAQGKHGGETANFEAALGAAYADMAKDTIGIRKRRAERRQKMMERMNKG
jgi:nitrous oxide reductase accessory protein NosL